MSWIVTCSGDVVGSPHVGGWLRPHNILVDEVGYVIWSILLDYRQSVIPDVVGLMTSVWWWSFKLQPTWWCESRWSRFDIFGMITKYFDDSRLENIYWMLAGPWRTDDYRFSDKIGLFDEVGLMIDLSN